MTAEVLKAWNERSISIKNIRQEDFVNQEVVTLQCPEGHWCDYDRAGS